MCRRLGLQVPDDTADGRKRGRSNDIADETEIHDIADETEIHDISDETEIQPEELSTPELRQWAQHMEEPVSTDDEEPASNDDEDCMGDESHLEDDWDLEDESHLDAD